MACGVARRFGSKTALQPIDLELREGETTALVGPNGAGKSTLIGLLAGALEPSAGRVQRRAGTRIGWAPQRPAHYGRLSARQNLEFFARLQAVPRPTDVAARLLEEFELGADEEGSSSNLSVGMRQRLNLAIAALSDPQVLLLDEPAAALDPRQRRSLWARAGRLTGSGGAVLFATQALEEVERFADCVVILLDGSLGFSGSLAEYEHEHADRLFA